MGALTKTGVVDGIAAVTGTVSLLNQDQRAAGAMRAYTKWLSVAFRGVSAELMDVTSEYFWQHLYQDANPPPGATVYNSLIFRRLIRSGAGIEVHDYVYFYGATPWNLDVEFSISVTGFRLWRQEILVSGSPIMSNDRRIADSWAAEPRSWTVSFGPLSKTNVTGSAPIPDAVYLRCYQRAGNATSYPCTYARDVVEWDEGKLNLAGLSKLYGTDKFQTVGEASGARWDALKAFTTETEYACNWGVLTPIILDFSAFGVWDRDGVLIPELRIDGPFQASLEHPASLEWSATP